MAHYCVKCGGFVGDVGVAYGYAGKWCYCGGGDGKVKRFQDLTPEEVFKLLERLVDNKTVTSADKEPNEGDSDE